MNIPSGAQKPLVVIGIRHNSPVCARVVADTIAELEPSHVLIEGPVDFNGRLDELLLDHTLPIALFSHVRREHRSRVTWTPFTEWSPEWVALRSASKMGARPSFIDLPTWHPEFDDTSPPHGPAVSSMLARLAVDTEDALWERVIESRATELTTDAMTDLLNEYFDAVRADDLTVSERERYMASWIHTVRDSPSRGAVVVVCGGLHRPAIMAELVRTSLSDSLTRPSVPTPDPELDVGSYLVPYSYERMSTVYPWWCESAWRDPVTVADTAIAAIVRNVRSHGHPASTVDFIGLRQQMYGLASLRGHAVPTRTDVLDAAASTLIDEALPTRLPWTTNADSARGQKHPVIELCLATLRGTRRGSLHPASPVPGLVHHVVNLLDAESLAFGTTIVLDLIDPAARTRSRILHQLRVLAVPGFERESGPESGVDPVSVEQWTLVDSPGRIPALIEAAAQGHTLSNAAGVALDAALANCGSDIPAVTRILFDAILCGLDTQSRRTGRAAVSAIENAFELGDVGLLLRESLDLWRHDSLFGSRGSTVLAAVIDSASARTTVLAGRLRASPAGADLSRIAAVAALSDAMRHAPEVLSADPSRELAATARDPGGAVDVRGAALGAIWDTTTSSDALSVVSSVRPEQLGDWLSGLFGVAREQFSDSESSDRVLDVVDDVVSSSTEHDFLLALPALRQAFEFFPPRERASIARRVGITPAPGESELGGPELSVDDGRRLDARVDVALSRAGLQ